MCREALRQRRNRQERIHAQRARDHRAIGHEQSLVHAAVAREHAAERVHRALQVIVAHRAAAQRMRRDQVAQVEHAPGRVGDEVAAQRVRMAADLFVHAGEDLLLPGLVPGDADPAVGFGPGRVEENRPARVVLPHHQVQHGVIHRAVRGVRRGGRVEIARQAVALRVFVAGHRILPAKQSEDRLGAIDVRVREREIFDGDALVFRQPLGVADQPDDVRAGRRRIAGRRQPAGTDSPARRFRKSPL